MFAITGTHVSASYSRCDSTSAADRHSTCRRTSGNANTWTRPLFRWPSSLSTTRKTGTPQESSGPRRWRRQQAASSRPGCHVGRSWTDGLEQLLKALATKHFALPILLKSRAIAVASRHLGSIRSVSISARSRRTGNCECLTKSRSGHSIASRDVCPIVITDVESRTTRARHGAKVGPVGAHPSMVAEVMHYSNAGRLRSG
jgi:hypothetical protein